MFGLHFAGEKAGLIKDANRLLDPIFKSKVDRDILTSMKVEPVGWLVVLKGGCSLLDREAVRLSFVVDQGDRLLTWIDLGDIAQDRFAVGLLKVAFIDRMGFESPVAVMPLGEDQVAEVEAGPLSPLGLEVDLGGGACFDKFLGPDLIFDRQKLGLTFDDNTFTTV